MDTIEPTTTVNLALLTDLAGADRTDGILHAVVAWTDAGEHVCVPLPRPVRVRLAEGPQLVLDLDGVGDVGGECADLGDLGPPYWASSGRTWRTLALPSVPPRSRHLTPDGLVRELAHRLAR